MHSMLRVANGQACQASIGQSSAITQTSKVKVFHNCEEWLDIWYFVIAPLKIYEKKELLEKKIIKYKYKDLAIFNIKLIDIEALDRCLTQTLNQLFS